MERSLRFLQRANAMASLGHSQLSALRAWAAVATVSIFDKHGARGELGASEFEWNNEDVNRCIEDLCKALESAVMAIGVAGDTSNLLPTFMTMQAHLLLIFVRFLWIRGSPSSLGRVQLWAVCTKIVRTTVSCLKLQLDSHVAFRHHGEELVKELLGSFLIALEIIYAHNGGIFENDEDRTKEGQEMGDAFADVTLTGIGFLPGLCTAVEHPLYVNLALAGINLLIKGFIAPTTWVSILQNHLPTRSLIGRMHADLGTESPRVALNICLSLARTRVGAEMLQNTGIFSHLLTLSKQLQKDNKVMSGSLEGPFNVWPNQDQPPEGQLWSLQLTVVTALIHSGGEKVLGGSLVESAFTYIASLKELLLLSLRAPVPGLDIQGRKKAKLQQPRTTITALQEVQHVMSLLCELSSHQMTWRRTLPDSIAEFEEMSLHLLAYIAREGIVRSGVYHSSHIGIRCQPVLKEEIAAHARPSIVGSSAGWFAVCARGCSVKERNGVASPPKNATAATTNSLLRTGSSSPSSGLVISGSSAASTSSAACTEYSDLVAISVYRLVLLLLKFTCKQVQHAVDRFESGGTADYGHFPQLPAPEVLYPLQDQVGAILIEVLRARDGKAVQGVVKDVCLLLLSILEKSLYLGVSVSRSCGLNPHPLRVDDFGKEYRALLSASQSHQFLEAPLRSLKRVVALAYPEIS